MHGIVCAVPQENISITIAAVLLSHSCVQYSIAAAFRQLKTDVCEMKSHGEFLLKIPCHLLTLWIHMAALHTAFHQIINF